jgi:metal-responsive CopG/Arc/MetJ family transcriptional regulator
MKVRASVTLSEELLKAVDKCARQQEKRRSNFIEAALWAFVKRQIRNEQNAHDLDIINRNADFLNREASDVLEYAGR